MSILASTSSASTAAGWGGMIIWLVVLFGFMYFFMIRPQQKACYVWMRKHNRFFFIGVEYLWNLYSAA